MSKLSLYKTIKNLLTTSNQRTDPVHGFQLHPSDLSEYLRNFLTKDQANKMIKNINSSGYLSDETGRFLKELLSNNDYDFYIKSIHDTQVESIFGEGIRCYGTTSLIGITNPASIEEVNLNNTIEKMTELPVLISRIKGNNGYSQGGIKINGTLILRIEKGTSKEEILYFNDASQTYNIKPSYIVGFLPVDEEMCVKDWVKPENKEQCLSSRLK